MRKTKIICTIGPASENPEILSQIIEAGMNVSRHNFSHGDHEEHAARINLVKELAKKHNLIIISDEIYEKLIYDGKEHVSIASLSEDSYERTIVVNGLSKTYAMTGWRVGYTASSAKLAKVMSNIQSHMTSNVCSISQYAALEALTGPQDSIKMMKSAFEERRNFMMKK